MPTGKQKLPAGQLVEHAAGYHAHLLGLDDSLSAANKHCHLVTHLSGWLEREGIAFHELAAPATKGFFRARRARGTPNLRIPRSLDPLLDYLRSCDVLVETIALPPSDPVATFCGHYPRYLLVERGLAEGSAHFCVYVAGLLAAERRRDHGVDWSALRAGDVRIRERAVWPLPVPAGSSLSGEGVRRASRGWSNASPRRATFPTVLPPA